MPTAECFIHSFKKQLTNSKVFPEKVIFPQLVKNYSLFMELENVYFPVQLSLS